MLLGDDIRVEFTKDGKHYSTAFDNDWRKGWHNGVAKLLQLALPLSSKFEKWVKENFGVSKTAAFHSRRAMYWSNPQRVYRMTRREIVDNEALCPRCRKKLLLEPYTKSEWMYRCPDCKFKIPRSSVIVVSLASRRGKS